MHPRGSHAFRRRGNELIAQHYGECRQIFARGFERGTCIARPFGASIFLMGAGGDSVATNNPVFSDLPILQRILDRVQRAEASIAQSNEDSGDSRTRRLLLLGQAEAQLKECHALLADPACFEEMKDTRMPIEVWGFLFERLHRLAVSLAHETIAFVMTAKG